MIECPFCFEDIPDTARVCQHCDGVVRSGDTEASGQPEPISLADELTKLSHLREQAVLSEEEFSRQKAKLLADSTNAKPAPVPAAPPAPTPGDAQRSPRNGLSGAAIAGIVGGALMVVILVVVLVFVLNDSSKGKSGKSIRSEGSSATPMSDRDRLAEEFKTIMKILEYHDVDQLLEQMSELRHVGPATVLTARINHFTGTYNLDRDEFRIRSNESRLRYIKDQIETKGKRNFGIRGEEVFEYISQADLWLLFCGDRCDP